MRMRFIAIVGAIAAASSALAAERAPPLSLNGVELGTTRDAWRALKIPAPASAHARRACSDEPGGAAAGLTSRGLPKDAVVCAVVDTYGSLRLPVNFRWNGQYAEDDVRYVFRAGRLTEIRAQLPADAFDAVMADFRRSYGAPAKEIHDEVKSEIGRLPRVTERWATAHGAIEIVDPATPGKLSVRLAAR